MSLDLRLSPEEALQRLESESAPAKARLKIFLGMAAGVGKTYAMLKEARLLVDRGRKVTIGWVEAHGRQETDALMEGLPRVPPRQIAYRGIQMQEMDLDAVLAQKPDLVLVDELAHTNAPDSRHPKRYQDILELLESGISVYTTVNIQHLESLADSVELVTLVQIRERVPDSVFDRADEVQIVDLPPEELIHRLEEGRVYTGEASRSAVNNFFTIGNLSMLREIALGQASRLASHKLLEVMRGDSSKGSISAAQQILVAVSSSPNSESLIRWARRLSYSLKADAHCLYVESGQALTEEDKGRLQKNLDLARSLGIIVETVQSADLAAGIVGYALDHAISIIIVGKSGLGSRRLFGGPTLTERIIKDSGGIAVFAVQEKAAPGPSFRGKVRTMIKTPGWQYLASLLAVALVTWVNLGIAGYIGYWAASIPYLALISLLGLRLERKPILMAALLSSLTWDFLFIPPRFTFYIRKPEDYLMLALYFILAITAGWATSQLKASERMLSLREKRISLLRDLASNLAGVAGLSEIVEVGRAYLKSAFDAESIVLLSGKDGDLVPQGLTRGFALDEKEETAARYCLKNDRPTGRGTSTLPVVAWSFVPLDTPKGTIGVIGLRQEKTWTDDMEVFLQTMARTLALAIERELLSEENRINLLGRESERLSKLILDSVSHELRTPLTVIKGSASMLADPGALADPRTGQALVAEIREASERLDAIVENLLSMNRLESGPMALHRTTEEVEDLVGAAVSALAKELEGHGVDILMPEALPALSCDAALLVQVLENLLRNAVRYAGASSHIRLEAWQEGACVHFAVSDDGPGVKEDDLGRIFDKFYRADRAVPGGTGLGLSICKGIVEAHGGRIEARLREPRGLSVIFRIPLEAQG